MDSTLEAVATQLYTRLDTARALSCLIQLRHRAWDLLASQQVDPLTYLDTVSGAKRYFDDCQAVSFLRKSPLLDTSWDRAEVAHATFEVCEKQCCETNYRLALIQYLPVGENRMGDRLLDILSRARKIAGRILGPIPDSLEFGIGPGTCFELKGSAFTTLADKVAVTPTTTPAARSIFELIYNDTYWCRRRVELGLPHLGITPGNRFTTVPKDAKTDRGICIEPLGNLACQLGVGRYLKRRLGLVGLHVDTSGVTDNPLDYTVARKDGQTIHRQLARKGSVDGSFATIDLTNASDTIARELVRLVIPDDWFTLLDALRSPKTLIKGRWHRLEKFSSMGNGFTFELETLLFASIISAACNVRIGSDLLVYGDDILLPNHLFTEASSVLKACGFTPNQKKSFATGSFRESCGGDYHTGLDVRPYFAKGSFTSPLEWISLHNAMRRLFPTRNKVLLERCKRAIPLALRVYGPNRIGDTVLHANEGSYPVILRDGCRWVRALSAKPRRLPLDRWGGFTLLLALLGTSSAGISIRGEISGWKLVRMSIS